MIIRISKADEKYAYFMMTLILFTSGTVYANLYSNVTDFIKVFITIISILVAFFAKEITIDYRSVTELLLICLGLFVLGLINGSKLFGILFLLFRIIGLFFFAVYCRSKNINAFKVLFNIVFVLAVFYLLCYVIFESGLFPFEGRTIRITLGNESRLANRTSLNYTCFCHIYYRWQSMNFLGSWTARNNGPFWEPGNYQIYLNFALVYYLFFMKRKKWYIVGTLIIAIINTTSTAGIMMLCSILIVYFITLKTSMYNKILLVISYMVITYVGVKLFSGKTNTISYDSRMKDTLLYFRNVDLAKLLIGNGYSSEKVRFNSLLIPIADFGVLGGYIYCLFFRYLMKLKKYYTIPALIIFTEWWGISLFTEPIIYLNISLFLLMEFVVTDKIA